LSNLLSNAIKYSGDKSRVSVTIEKSEDFVDIQVSDNGVGISEHAKAKVFERFYQDKSSENVSEPGTGIGLALVKELMQMHHGDALLAEQNERGCCFVLRLPKGNAHFSEEQIIEPIDIAERESLNIPTRSVDDTNDSVSHPQGANASIHDEDLTTLLIVDDNQELLNFISLRLSASFKILQATNGEEGYAIACEALPDLIISDVNMPVMTGLVMAQQIKSNQSTQTIPIILLTAKATKREVVAGFSVGADDYLTKPFDTSELIMRVNAQINARKMVRQTLQLERESASKLNKAETYKDKIHAIIAKELGDPSFNVEQLAKALHTSRDTLIRKCKKECNSTPLNLIIEQRMTRADALLKQKTMSISEVAYACGFESLAYFSKSYKKHRGVNPSDV
jgi:YesN/AraC family two-component response regulator